MRLGAAGRAFRGEFSVLAQGCRISAVLLSRCPHGELSFSPRRKPSTAAAKSNKAVEDVKRHFLKSSRQLLFFSFSFSRSFRLRLECERV